MYAREHTRNALSLLACSSLYAREHTGPRAGKRAYRATSTPHPAPIRPVVGAPSLPDIAQLAAVREQG